MTPIRTLHDAELRLQALAEIRSTPDFEAVAASFKRIRNIVKQAQGFSHAFDASLLESGPESDLYEAYLAAQRNLQGKSYRVILEGIASLRPQIDAFFDKVLVNVPDPKIRSNRLSFLARFLIDLTTFADFSEIVTAGEQK
jgi:glycyl-tRNA synthetase beta chain